VAIVGERIIRIHIDFGLPYVEARCVPIPSGGWRVMSAGRETTEHPSAGNPWLAVDLHVAANAPSVSKPS